MGRIAVVVLAVLGIALVHGLPMNEPSRNKRAAGGRSLRPSSVKEHIRDVCAYSDIPDNDESVFELICCLMGAELAPLRGRRGSLKRSCVGDNRQAFLINYSNVHSRASANNCLPCNPVQTGA